MSFRRRTTETIADLQRQLASLTATVAEQSSAAAAAEPPPTVPRPGAGAPVAGDLADRGAGPGAQPGRAGRRTRRPAAPGPRAAQPPAGGADGAVQQPAGRDGPRARRRPPAGGQPARRAGAAAGRAGGGGHGAAEGTTARPRWSRSCGPTRSASPTTSLATRSPSVRTWPRWPSWSTAAAAPAAEPPHRPSTRRPAAAGQRRRDRLRARGGVGDAGGGGVGR